MEYIYTTEGQNIKNGEYEDNIIKEISIIKRNPEFDMLDTSINIAAFIFSSHAILYYQEDYYEPIIEVQDKNNIFQYFDELVKQKLLEIKESKLFNFEIEDTCNFIFKDSSMQVNEELTMRTR